MEDALAKWERELDDQLKKEALHFAAQRGDLEEVKTLLDSGVPVSAFDEIGYTPLHYAAANEHLAVMRALIDSGADVNARDKRMAGDTPLGDVAGNCSLAVAKLLVESGADPSIPGWMQITVLGRARTRKRGDGPAVLQLLQLATASEWRRNKALQRSAKRRR